jgi:hypothetical protein
MSPFTKATIQTGLVIKGDGTTYNIVIQKVLPLGGKSMKKANRFEQQGHLLTFLAHRSKPSMKFSHDTDKHQILNSLAKARREWRAAEKYFDNVSDSDLVDYAIYSIEAEKKKYIYLLKQAKLNGVTCTNSNIKNTVR